MNNSSRFAIRMVIAASVVLAIAISGIVIYMRSRIPPPGGPGSVVAKPLDPELEALLEQSREHQRQGKWKDAKNGYKALLDKLPEDHKPLRDDVDRNIHTIDAIPDTDFPRAGEEIKVPAKAKKPDEISPENLLKYYPVGKRVRSNSVATITGTGSHAAWGLKGEAHFAYFANVGATTEVKENDRTRNRLVFEVFFEHVLQMRKVSEQSLELKWPDGPLFKVLDPVSEGLGLFGKGLELSGKKFGRAVPYFKQALILKEILEKADPNLKNTLTYLSNLLRRNGVPITDSDDTGNWAVQVERLQGTRVRIVYVNGIGVTHITRISGLEVDKGDLVRIAHASTQLMDYFIFPSAEKKVGEKWNVAANDVGGLALPFDLGAEISGSLSLRRDSDAVNGKIAIFKLTGGTVNVRDAKDRAVQEGRLNVSGGEMRFSFDDKLVQDARIEFEATSLYETRGHLLFGTVRERNLKIESRYAAKTIDAPELQEAATP